MSSGDDILSATDKWREEGKALRRQLVSERTKLAERVAQIDMRLAALPNDDDAPAPPAQLPKPPTGQPTPTLQRVSPGTKVPDLVRAIVKAATRPLTAGEIISFARGARPGTEPSEIHSTLYRAVQRGEMEAQGEKGSRTFTWKGSAG